MTLVVGNSEKIVREMKRAKKTEKVREKVNIPAKKSTVTKKDCVTRFISDVENGETSKMEGIVAKIG